MSRLGLAFVPKVGHNEINPDGFSGNVRNQLVASWDWSPQHCVTLRKVVWQVMGIESENLPNSMWHFEAS